MATDRVELAWLTIGEPTVDLRAKTTADRQLFGVKSERKCGVDAERCVSSAPTILPRSRRAAVNFLSFPIGPILGGWILTNYWWGWVFLLNVPVALIGLVAAFKLLPEARAHERPALDLVGVGASVVGLVALVYGLIQAGEHGWRLARAPCSRWLAV